MPGVQSFDHLVLTVRNVPRTLTFYRDVLGMEVVEFSPANGSKRHALRFGAQKLNLHQAGAEFEPKAHAPVPGSADMCFLSDTPLAEWMEHLCAVDVPVETGPVPRTGATGPIISIYLRDPDGNLIEISNLA